MLIYTEVLIWREKLICAQTKVHFDFWPSEKLQVIRKYKIPNMVFQKKFRPNILVVLLVWNSNFTKAREFQPNGPLPYCCQHKMAQTLNLSPKHLEFGKQINSRLCLPTKKLQWLLFFKSHVNKTLFGKCGPAHLS